MKISQYSAGGSIVSGDKFVIARGGQNYAMLGAAFIGSPGELRNAWIVPQSFANLQVALTCPGNITISPTSPAYVYIGGWREMTSQPATPTMANGTNWFAMGSAEMATKEVDLFYYLGYNATDGVVAGVSRIPYATKYSDFSTTSTNERYCRIGNIAHATANDEYHVVARFAATLSAGAGYTWSIPTYTPSNLIQHPIWETRWLTWAPVITGYSANPTTTLYRYKFRLDTCQLDMDEQGNGTSNSTTKLYTLPMTSSKPATSYNILPMPAAIDNGAVVAAGYVQIQGTSAVAQFYRSLATNWTASGGCRVVGAFGQYPIG